MTDAGKLFAHLREKNQASGTDYGRMERIAFQAESYVLVIDGEHINVGAVIRALYTDHRRLAGIAQENLHG